MSIFSRISNRVLFIINMVVVLLFLAACFNTAIDPKEWPLLSLLGLAFPFLLIIVLLFLIWWLFIRRKWALLSACALLLGGDAITNFFAFNITHSFKEEKNQAHIRVATWNVARFVEMIRNNNKGSQTRLKMLEQIKTVNADILCFQEFTSSSNPDWYDNIHEIKNNLGYPYYYFSHDWDGDRLFNGSVIFSRFPITDSGMVRYPRPTLPEALVFVDIKKGDQSFRVYTTHLQSNQFAKEDISKIEELKGGGNVVSNMFHIFKKLKTAIAHRSIQADMVAAVIDNSPLPVIVCGDMNDVPNSYTYKTIKGDLHDVFLYKGFGIGRTYNSLSPTLRIDYILTDKLFKPHQFKRITTDYSDHFMLVADIALSKK